MICDLSNGRRFNLIERGLFRAASRDTQIARGFQRLTGRVVQPRDFLNLPTLLRVAYVNLTRSRPLSERPVAWRASAQPKAETAQQPQSFL
jgi:hypothetical protein